MATETDRRRRRKRRKKRKGGGLKIGKDLKVAEKLADKFSLIPSLDRVDASRPQEVTDLIGERQAAFDAAGQRAPEQQALLDTLQEGLGGLTAEENVLTRERGEESLDRSFQGGLRDLTRSAGLRGVRGAASQAGLGDLLRERGFAQRGLERDIQLENIDVQDRRRGQLGSFLDQLISGEFSREQEALGGLERTTQLSRLDELNRELVNIDQQRREKATRGSTLLGLLGLRGNRRAGRKAFKLERDRFDLERQASEQNAAAIQAQAQQFGALANSIASSGEGSF